MHRAPTSSEKKSRRDTAVEWLSRIKSGNMTQVDREAFEAWLQDDDANRAAFDKSLALWKELKGVSVATVATPARRRLWPLAAAAVAVLLVFTWAADDLVIRWKSNFSTETAEVKTVTLEDGSRIELNADTAIAYHYSGEQRYLTLLKGEAWFEVASDPHRPFVVEAAGGKTTATGTSFNIAITSAGTQVTVTEHEVSVTSGGQTSAVKEGQMASYGRDSLALAVQPAESDAETAWRRGFLVFHDKPLGEVIAAINRYFHGYCLIMSPSIRSRRVSGLFRTSEPLESIRTIELSLGLRATYIGDYLIFLRG
jgi:transmembrane sensor